MLEHRSAHQVHIGSALTDQPTLKMSERQDVDYQTVKKIILSKSDVLFL